MRIMILGHTSLLAGNLIRELAQRHEIVKAGRGPNADVFLDIALGIEGAANVPSCDAMVHCVASFEPDSLEGGLRNERVNSLGAFAAAQLCLSSGCKHLVYCSSISCIRHPENEYYNSYAISKSHGEDNLALCCEQLGIRFTSLRISQLYDAAGEARRHQPFLYHIVDQAQKSQDIFFWGVEDRLRNLVFIEDLPLIVERVLELEVTGVHPVVSPTSHTLSQIAAVAYDVFETSGSISFLADKQNIKSIHIPPMTDLYTQIGMHPETDLRQGLRRVRTAREGSKTFGSIK